MKRRSQIQIETRNSVDSPEQTRRARSLRRRQTPTETRLWGALRGRRFAHAKFRRQHPIGPYIVDFYCHSSKLVLELDGQSHVGKEAYDARRTAWLEGQGLRVLRVWDNHVYADYEAVLQMIYNACAPALNPGLAALARPFSRERREKGGGGFRFIS